MCRISVDFNTMMMDEDERVLINLSTHEGLAEHLSPGLRVMLYDEELEVEANLEFDGKGGMWWGRPDWSTRRDISYLADNVAS
ncbi:MAG TPA: hypothetical protein VGE45_01850 [Chloroflexia bacterium]|jgi:hypothetical protein